MSISTQAVAAPTTPAPPLATALKGDAKTQWEAGRALYAVAKSPKDYETAITNFKRAYELSQDPRLFFAIAACQKELLQRGAAYDSVQRYLTEGDKVITKKEREQATELASILHPYISVLTITTSDDGVQLTLDSTDLGLSPLAKPVTIDAIKHTLHATKTGMKPNDMTFDAVAGGTTPVTITMVPDIHQGRLHVDVSDNAAIQIDQKIVGNGSADVTLPSGIHVLHLSAKGKKSRDDDNLVITDDQTTTLSFTLEDEAHTVPAWVWIAGAVVVAGGASVAGYEIFKPGTKTGTAPVGNLGTGNTFTSFRFH